VKEEHKSRMHLFSWQPSWKLLLQRTNARPFFPTKVSLLFQTLHVSNEGFTLHGLVLWCFKMKTLHMPIHLWIM
jgi:hypothetical protein